MERIAPGDKPAAAMTAPRDSISMDNASDRAILIERTCHRNREPKVRRFNQHKQCFFNQPSNALVGSRLSCKHRQHLFSGFVAVRRSHLSQVWMISDLWRPKNSIATRETTVISGSPLRGAPYAPAFELNPVSSRQVQTLGRELVVSKSGFWLSLFHDRRPRRHQLERPALHHIGYRRAVSRVWHLRVGGLASATVVTTPRPDRGYPP